MKNLFFRISLIFLLFCNCLYYAQFNTITQKKVEDKITQNFEPINNPPTKALKEKKSLKKILGITTKSDLKNEIDSLKSIMLQFSHQNKKQSELKSIQDSLIKEIKQKITVQKSKNLNRIPQYNFISEPEDMIYKIRMPLQNKLHITSPYGNRIHPVFGYVKPHNGIDLKANYEHVYSVLDGVVTETGWDKNGGGNFIKIKHFNRFETSYLHLSEIYYQPGELVKAGFVIAKSGNSGSSTGPHLHFAVKEYGKFINPAHFLNDLIKINNLIATHYEK